MYSLGFDWEAVDFFSFIADIAEQDDDLQIMYGIGGERDLAEHELDHLPGYADSRPVRIGNAACTQTPARRVGRAARLGLPAQQGRRPPRRPDLADPRPSRSNAALKHWREPDAGIWEVRGELQHFTSSKIMCWVAVDRGARLAADDRPGRRGRRSGSMAADEIKADILEHGVDERGVFTQHYGTTALDASLLLARAGALPAARRPADRRHRAGHRRRAHRARHGAALPRRRDRRRLRRRGGLVHDLLVLAGVGAVRDRRVPPRPRAVRASCCRSPARWSSTPRRSTRTPAQHLGNFPQAFTHLALINAVMHVIDTAGLQDGQPSTYRLRD